MDEASYVAQQDALRPLRVFVGMLSGAANADQSFAGQDGTSWNVPGAYQAVGPNGYSVEGKPIAATRNGGLYISPVLLLIGMGAAAAMFWKH